MVCKLTPVTFLDRCKQTPTRIMHGELDLGDLGKPLTKFVSVGLDAGAELMTIEVLIYVLVLWIVGRDFEVSGVEESGTIRKPCQ